MSCQLQQFPTCQLQLSSGIRLVSFLAGGLASLAGSTKCRGMVPDPGKDHGVFEGSRIAGQAAVVDESCRRPAILDRRAGLMDIVSVRCPCVLHRLPCGALLCSRVIYAICLPRAFACLRHEGLAQRRACVALIKRMWNAVAAMEQLLLGKGDGDPLPPRRKKFLQECVDDLAWRHGQIAREILIACESGGWNEANEECRLFSYLLFAGCPNTKFYLEDAFGHLSDVASRFARHHKMTSVLYHHQYVSYVP